MKDFDELDRLHTDPRVMATLGGVRSSQQTRQFLQEKISHWQTHGFGYWMFFSEETDTFVGRGGIQHVEIGGAEEIEIGYTVAAQYWGRGFATEMARELVHIAFGQLGLPALVCFTLTSNRASRRVMEKVGFHFEKALIHHGQPTVLYRLRSEAQLPSPTSD